MGKAFNCLVGRNRNFLSPTIALALQCLNEWGPGSRWRSPSRAVSGNSSTSALVWNVLFIGTLMFPLSKKKKNLQSEGGKKRCFLTKTAMEFGRAACSLYNQIPFCASIILQCPWLLSQQVLEGRFYLQTGSFAMRDPGAAPW